MLKDGGLRQFLVRRQACSVLLKKVFFIFQELTLLIVFFWPLLDFQSTKWLFFGQFYSVL